MVALPDRPFSRLMELEALDQEIRSFLSRAIAVTDEKAFGGANLSVMDCKRVLMALLHPASGLSDAAVSERSQILRRGCSESPLNWETNFVDPARNELRDLLIELERLRKQEGFEPMHGDNLLEHPNAKLKRKGYQDTSEQIDALAGEGLSESEARKRIGEIAVTTGIHAAELWKNYEAKQAEIDRGLEVEASTPAYDRILKLAELSQVKWEEIFPAPLAKALLDVADAKRIDVAFIIQPMLAAIGSSIGGNIGIVGQDGASEWDRWMEFPVFDTAIVNPPSSGKSTGDRIALAPIQELQIEENQRHADRLEELEEIKEAWNLKQKDERDAVKHTSENPRVFKQEIGDQRKFLLNGATPEAAQRRIAEQSDGAGVLWAMDELSGLFASLDEFKAGKESSARSFLLSAWNGKLKGSLERVDASRSFSFKNQTLSITGGIQPAKARKIFASSGDGKQDPDGLTSRFLFACPRPHPKFAEWSDRHVDIFGLLKGLYDGMRSLPTTTLQLSPEAKALWQDTWQSLKRQQLEEQGSNPALAAYLGKLCSYTLRLTLVLHCMEHHYTTKEDFSQVAASTVERARTWMLYYLSQYRELQTQFVESASDGLPEFLKQLRDLCEQRGGVLVARDVLTRHRRKKLNSSEVKSYFQQLASVDPSVEFDGKTLSLKKNKDGVADQHDQQNSQTPTTQAIEVADRTISKTAARSANGSEAADRAAICCPNDQQPQTQAQQGSQNLLIAADQQGCKKNNQECDRTVPPKWVKPKIFPNTLVRYKGSHPTIKNAVGDRLCIVSKVSGKKAQISQTGRLRDQFVPLDDLESTPIRVSPLNSPKEGGAVVRDWGLTGEIVKIYSDGSIRVNWADKKAYDYAPDEWQGAGIYQWDPTVREAPSSGGLIEISQQQGGDSQQNGKSPEQT